jgi:hypothetical protein
MLSTLSWTGLWTSLTFCVRAVRKLSYWLRRLPQLSSVIECLDANCIRVRVQNHWPALQGTRAVLVNSLAFQCLHCQWSALKQQVRCLLLPLRFSA